MHGYALQTQDELGRELPASAEDVAPRLVDDIQLLTVEVVTELKLARFG